MAANEISKLANDLRAANVESAALKQQLQQMAAILEKAMSRSEIIVAKEAMLAFKNEVGQTKEAFTNLESAQQRTSRVYGQQIKQAQELLGIAQRLGQEERARVQATNAFLKGPGGGPSGYGNGGVPNAGGSNVANNAAKEFDAIRTMGFVTPQSVGTTYGASLNKLSEAAKKAEQSIRDSYSHMTDDVKVFDRYVEQATGHIVVQAKVTRDLYDAEGNVSGKQTFTAYARTDPFSGKTSQYSGMQQAFADQAGGIDKANQALSKYGLTLNNVTGFYKDLNSNTARFSVTGTDGVSTAMGAMDQFGNATLHASRNAQTLAQNVGRNVEKVVEWAIATTLLYTVMNSVMTAGKELQDIEETMIDIQIATGASADELNRYYNAALDVANLTGSDVTDTLEAQAKAYRAAGSEADRFNTANTLLRDSMILSRLSGMDQAKALDTLVAALRQSGKALTDGESLLDKWTRTSQVAGVSIEDLAESFAITADVATTVGVSLDQLNGIIAVLAEKTTLSGTEVGNAARTMFAGITSDEAVKTLGEFGIAVRSVNGDMRDWMEINQDVVDLMNAGILNDEQINKLANALGGGSRRGPQLITLWRNFGQVSNIAAESFDANGEAASAMQIKLDSLQAAINELHNAFNELVQALGYDGGFLEMMTGIIEQSTNLVRSLKDIATAFDDGAASITAALVAYVGFKKLMSGTNLSGFNTLGASPGANQGWGGFPGVGNYLGQNPNMSTIGGNVQAGFQGMIGPGGAIAAGEVLNGAMNGESADRIGARAGASLAGAFVGNMILPGFGGLIGAVLADSFVHEIQGKADALREIANGGKPASAGEAEQRITEAFGKGAFSAFGGMDYGVKQKYSDIELAQLAAKAVSAGVQKSQLGLLPSANVDYIKSKGFTQEEAAIVNDIMTSLSPENFDLLLKATNDYNDALKNQQTLLEQTAVMMPTSVKNQAELLQGKQGDALRRSFAAQESTLYQDANRTGNAEDYNNKTNRMQQVATATAAVASALEGATMSEQRYVEIGNLLLNATDEQYNKIVLLTSGINDAKDALEGVAEAQANGQTWAFGSDISKTQSDLNQYNIELEHTLELTKQAAAIQFARDTYISPTAVPTDQNGNPLTRAQSGFDKALAEQYSKQDAYAQFQGIDPQALRESITDPIVLAFADGYVEVKGLTSDFSKGLLDQMKETADAMKEEISFAFKDMRDVNIDPQALDQKIKYYENVMKQYEPYGYSEKKQNIGILGEGNQVRVLNTTMTALNLAIEDLTEVEKKQLEGQWNLPSGATAYVPINSLFASSSGSGAGGNAGIGESTGVMIDQSANKMDDASNKMLSAADAMKVRDLNSARWEGLGAQYMKGQGEKPVEVDVKTNVNITPAQVLLNLDGRIVANQLQQYLSEQLSNVSRTTPGGGPKIS